VFTARRPWFFALVVLTACSGDDPDPDTDQPVDASTPRDASLVDSGRDAGKDGSLSDASHDTGAPDTGPADTGIPDSGAPDASDAGKDAGSTDAGKDAAAEAGTDAGDAGPVADAGDAGTPDDAGSDASIDAAIDGPADAGTDGSVVPVGAIGIWSFDENTGTSAADSSGMGHTATLVGGATWAPGKSGSGLSLDGATGFADLGASIVDLTRSFSVTCWLKFNSVPGWQTAISQEGTQLSVFTLKKRDDNAKFDIDFPGQDVNDPNIWTVAQSTTAPAVSTWYHLVGVYDLGGQKARIFVNGVLEDSQTSNIVLPAPGHTIVGRSRWQGASTAYFSGVIDDVRIFPRALGDAEVVGLYEGTK
jgi:hypothetical protein